MRLMPFLCSGFVAFAVSVAHADEPGWPAYGADAEGTRYSTAREITKDNVGRLGVAWQARSGEMEIVEKTGRALTFEATPILAEGRLYIITALNSVLALDPGTGKTLWRFASPVDATMHYSDPAARGVSSWIDTEAEAGAPCRHRILFGTLDGRLFALDGATGKPCAGFGADGQVDLTIGIRLRDIGDYEVTSPPAVFENLVIVGSSIGDNRAVDLEYGVVRAYDARSGELVWAFDPIPRGRPDDPARAQWTEKSVVETGAGNVWAPISVDARRGLVFLPTGSASPDFFGGERLGDNLYANSLVVLNARTGERVWHRQLVHHDLWDYDLPAQPTLVELERGDRTIPAVIQATKMGMLFTFERTTGAPIFEIEERPVPQTDVPGEVISPTQPFPVAPPPLVSHKPLARSDAYGLTFYDRGICAAKIAASRSEGIYTPPSLEGTIMYPGYAGGMNWGGIAFDPKRQLVFANVLNVAMRVRLVPREQVTEENRHSFPGFSRQTGTPYVMSREALLSPFGAPCNAPPWGTLAAVDMADGTIKWQVPLGTGEDLVPFGQYLLPRGAGSVGGPLATVSGVVFIGASADNYLRAFDSETGAELWKGRLPAGGQATPMTYVWKGKQYVVIAAGGHRGAGTTPGDHVVAFALPD